MRPRAIRQQSIHGTYAIYGKSMRGARFQGCFAMQSLLPTLNRQLAPLFG
jgi:hypothetical protein